MYPLAMAKVVCCPRLFSCFSTRCRRTTATVTSAAHGERPHLLTPHTVHVGRFPTIELDRPRRAAATATRTSRGGIPTPLHCYVAVEAALTVTASPVAESFPRQQRIGKSAGSTPPSERRATLPIPAAPSHLQSKAATVACRCWLCVRATRGVGGDGRSSAPLGAVCGVQDLLHAQ